MKLKTTRKNLLQGFGRDSSLAVGYCDAWYILKAFDAFAYTAGVYGWNFDAYEIDGVLITTGYRNLIGRTPRFVQEFEEKAKKLFSWETPGSFTEKQEKARVLCREWIKKEFSK